jgi:hypothetical protein
MPAVITSTSGGGIPAPGPPGPVAGLSPQPDRLAVININNIGLFGVVMWNLQSKNIPLDRSGDASDSVFWICRLARTSQRMPGKVPKTSVIHNSTSTMMEYRRLERDGSRITNRAYQTLV